MIATAYVAGLLTGAIFIHWRWKRWHRSKHADWGKDGYIEIEHDADLKGEGNGKSYEC